MSTKSIIKTVTVTGADDSVNIEDLFKIQNEFPFVEFGILISDRYSFSGGANRFPSRDWIKKLINENNKSSLKLNLSGHICGNWVKHLLLGTFPDFSEIDSKMFHAFNRWQINTHAQKHKIDFDKLEAILKYLAYDNKSVIFQIDNVNDIITECKKRKHENISGLFDLSHGAGILPSEWPKPTDGVYCGYAGGLSPSNVIDQIEKIIPLVDEKIIWIDAETHLRSDDDRNFDLNKVEIFLKNSEKYIIR